MTSTNGIPESTSERAHGREGELKQRWPRTKATCVKQNDMKTPDLALFIPASSPSHLVFHQRWQCLTFQSHNKSVTYIFLTTFFSFNEQYLLSNWSLHANHPSGHWRYNSEHNSIPDLMELTFQCNKINK